ncbi:hypothetical protein QAD02_018522 [Eretmocerus hayati]|uniref:Uncharacterized protein n=1 Tax=Eretmocerus hayati TaxID=131215 RepID=A0ACC2PH35_9HYME|nr:hypothetical protein QAD02_018522 [Eretmocerus hayati]
MEYLDTRLAVQGIGPAGMELPLNNFALVVCSITRGPDRVIGPKTSRDVRSTHFVTTMQTATYPSVNLAIDTGNAKEDILVSNVAQLCWYSIVALFAVNEQEPEEENLPPGVAPLPHGAIPIPVRQSNQNRPRN